MDQETFRATLWQFTGSSEFYRHVFGTLQYTEGVKFLADEGGLWWLIDLVASLQSRARKDSALREFQLWELKVADGEATLTCSRDSEDEAFREEIEYTDCLLDYVRLYVENRVMLLPSEH